MITVLQDLYIAVMKPFIKPSNKLNQRTKNILMTGCFLLIIFIFCVARVLRKNEYHNYFSFVGCVLMLFIAVLALEKELKPVPWSKPIAYSWIALCVVMIGSDFKVTKVFSMIGYMFLFAFMGVFFVWNNHSKRDMLWGNFTAAVRLSFLIITAVSFLFRPRIQGYRYAGTFINPNMFALYLITVFVVYIVYLDQLIQKKKPLRACIGLFIEMGFGTFLLFMTQARTSFLAVVIVGGLWFFIRIHQHRKEKQAIFFGKYIVVLVGLVIFSFPVAYQLLQTLPKLVNHPISYEKDKLYVMGDGFGVVANASQVSGTSMPPQVNSEQTDQEQDAKATGFSRFWTSLQGNSLNQILNGRVGIFEEYIAKMDLWGHKKYSIKMDGVTIPHAHNNMIQFGFSYGYLAMIPYGLLNLFAVLRSIQYFRKKDAKSSYAFLPLGIVIAFTIATLTEAIVLPFQCFPAFAYWFIIGALLPKDLT